MPEQAAAHRPDVLLGGGLEVVPYGHRLEHLELLERAGEAGLGSPVRPPSADVAAVQLHAAAIGSVLTEDAVEQRRLPAAIGPDDPEDLPALDLERHVVDRPDAAERLGDVANPDHRGVARPGGGDVSDHCSAPSSVAAGADATTTMTAVG